MRRRKRMWAVATASAAAMVLTGAAAPAPDPYAAPRGTAVPVSGGVQDRYAAVRADIEAARETARRVGDHGLQAALDAFLAGERQFLAFDARGSGRVVEVLSDLATADRIAVVVPGADGRIGTFDSPKWAGGSAVRLRDAAGPLAGGTRLAVVAWLGYDTPAMLGISVARQERATSAAHELDGFLAELRTVNASAPIALVCHSYGSVVCAHTGARAPIADMALIGSPGTGSDSVAELATPARVWAARGSADFIQLVPHASLFGFGFGADPVSDGFGARVFDAGSAGHSGYFAPGSVALHNLALIALGRTEEVSRG